jgi:protein-tyrosine phosphatase
LITTATGGDGGAGVIVDGNFEIAAISAHRIGAYMKTELRVTLRDDAGNDIETREIAHFWYDTWPDHGVPTDTGGVTSMLAAVRAQSEGGTDAPWIVHCSAGIGRTGTFIGIDMGMRQLHRDGEVQVVRLIESMRGDRGGMVQAPEQAQFIHTALEKYAATFNAERIQRQTDIADAKVVAAAAAIAFAAAVELEAENEAAAAAAAATASTTTASTTTLPLAVAEPSNGFVYYQPYPCFSPSGCKGELCYSSSCRAAIAAAASVAIATVTDDANAGAPDTNLETTAAEKTDDANEVGNTSKHQRYGTLSDEDAVGYSVEYIWTNASSLSDDPPPVLRKPTIAPGDKVVDGRASQITSQTRPTVPINCHSSGYKTVMLTLRKRGHAAVTVTQAFQVLPTEPVEFERDDALINITMPADVELLYSWDEEIPQPDRSVAGVQAELGGGVHRIDSAPDRRTATIDLDCSKAGVRTMHTLAFSPGHAFDRHNKEFTVKLVDRPTFARTGELLSPFLKKEARLYYAFDSPPEPNGTATQEWLVGKDITLEDAVDMYDSGGTPVPRTTELHWLVTQRGRAPLRGKERVSLVRVKLPTIVRQADGFGPGKLVAITPLDPDECSAIYTLWGESAGIEPAATSEFEWVEGPLQLDCTTPGDRVLQVLAIHPTRMPTRERLVFTVEQLLPPVAMFSVEQETPSAKIAKGKATSSATAGNAPVTLCFNTKLVPPPGSIYTFRDIVYTAPTVGVDDDNPVERFASSSTTAYTTPFLVAQDASFIMVAARPGFASSAPFVKTPPVTERVAAPTFKLITSPKGIVVIVNCATSRAQIMCKKVWPADSAAKPKHGDHTDQWKPLSSGSAGPDGFRIPIECALPGPHTVMAIGRSIGMGDSDPVSSITVDVQHAASPAIVASDDGFTITAPINSTVRWCYAAGKSGDTEASLASLGLKPDPYRWKESVVLTATKIDDSGGSRLAAALAADAAAIRAADDAATAAAARVGGGNQAGVDNDGEGEVEDAAAAEIVTDAGGESQGAAVANATTESTPPPPETEATREIKYGTVTMPSLVDLAKQGSTLYVFAVTLLHGQAPSIPTLWKKALRHTYKMNAFLDLSAGGSDSSGGNGGAPASSGEGGDGDNGGSEGGGSGGGGWQRGLRKRTHHFA